MEDFLMQRVAQSRKFGASIAAVSGVLWLAGTPVPATAQDAVDIPPTDYLDALKSCQALTDDAARLACFDEQVAGMVKATETGEVQIVDKEDVRETKRSLFGFSLPKIALFGDGDDEEDELLETTITSVRYQGRRSVRFTTEEGAVWEISSVPSRLRTINAGDKVVFKRAALGSFFIRINGQTGVKGRRVE
jgi:hypothetical protein